MSYVVVVDPGTEDEEVLHMEFRTYEQARRYAEMLHLHEEDADVMKKLDDGTLTTEF